MPLEQGTRLGPYEIIGRLGRGGMGEVYRAHDPRLQRDVAIKVLPSDFAADPERLRRFEAEAHATAALNHPNILAVFDIGSVEDKPYVVSELLEGQTLREALHEGTLTLRRVIEYARQIADGLASAHARGIVHRDIKPENLFLTTDGRVKILDFGIAKRITTEPNRDLLTTLAEAPRTGTGTIVGTVGYMAPEQATGRTVDFRCDQFAFGVVLYELLSGRRTFQRQTDFEELTAIVREEPRPLAELNPDVPLPLQWLVSRCLTKNPAERYESTRDLVRDLETMATHLGQPPKRPGMAQASNLPMPRTPLIGRETELVLASQLVLRESVRLVTFTGAAGTGKTRLALQVANELADRFTGGVFFVGLATIADASLVAPVVAQVFGVRPSAQVPLEQALKEQLEHYHTTPTLLVIDTFEHVLGSARFVASLLATGASLKILVTSREPLHLYEEHEQPVPPLPRPDPSRIASLDVLARNPSVRLFVERATASKPDFMLTSENARAIAEICNRLDGLPLAIELAAARVKTLPPSAMLSRLQSRLQVLTGGARDLPARQQTLRGAMAWSHDLLGEAEQRLFRRMSVFIGGCTFEAIEAVADTRHDLGIDVLDGIDSLVNKSLTQLIEQPDGEARLTAMETIREYSLERLVESGEEQAVRKAHAAYYLVLAEEAAGELDGVDQPIWVDRLDRDLDNLRAALKWLIATENADWALRMGTALLRYWELRELFTEGRQLLDAVLRLPGSAAALAARAKGLFASSVLAAGQRDRAAQLQLQNECLGIYRGLKDQQGMAVVVNALAVTYKQEDEFAKARHLFEESYAFSLDLGDTLMQARTLSNLASVLREEGAYEFALTRHQEAMALFHTLGDGTGVAWSLHHQGDVARDQGDFATAQSFYLQALEAFQTLGDSWSVGSLLTDLGSLAIDQGDIEMALTRLREAFNAFQQLGGHKRGLARVLEGFACAAARQGDASRALRLAGAAAALRNVLGTSLVPAEQRQLLSNLRRADQQLGTADRSRVWMEGWTMTMERAIEYALAGSEPSSLRG